MLNLSGNEYFDEISILGELKNLQILILNETNIEEIPQEIGQLTKLRCLSTKFCDYLSQIALSVISNLYLLENKGKFFLKVKISKLDCMNSLEFLWNCPDEYISFHIHNLEKLEITCENLKRLPGERGKSTCQSTVFNTLQL